jgi:hypothetical protein
MTLHDEIYKEVVAELLEDYPLLHRDVVEAVARVQFEFATLEMEKANLEDGGKDCRLQYLGTFRVKPLRLKSLIEKDRNYKEWLKNNNSSSV